jgi:Protein of unknown function (DUF1616)
MSEAKTAVPKARHRCLEMAVILAILMIASLLVLPQATSAATPAAFSQANSAIQDAYTAVYTAQIQDFADVGNLVSQLNASALLVNKAIAENSTDPSQATADLASATSIAQGVLSSTAAVADAGTSAHRLLVAYEILMSLVVVLIAGMAYAVSGRVYQWWWVSAYRDYDVRIKDRAEDEPKERHAPKEESRFSLDRRARKGIATAGLVLLTIVLVFSILQPAVNLFPNTQGNTQMGLLGPNQVVGGYPTNVTQSQRFLLYGLLKNDEGASQYYEVMVKLGAQGTVVSNSTAAKAPVIGEYYFVMGANQTSLFPMELSIGHAGTGYHLIFEVWSYQHVTAGWSFVYDGVFDELQVNVTA